MSRSMDVTEMTAWADRQIYLGTGANIKIGGSVKFNPGDDKPATQQFEETLTKVLGIVNRFGDQIENNVQYPEKWPGAPTKENA